MNKIILSIAIAISLATSLSAQDAPTTTFGVRAGVNFYNINGKDSNGDKLENGLHTGFNVGVNAEIPIAPDFYFQPGLLFSTKGSRTKQDILGIEITSNLNLAYIEVPLNLLYKPVLGTGHMLLGFGPYVAYGVAGKAKFDSPLGSSESDVKFQSTVDLNDSSSNSYMRAFDAGGNILFGYELAMGLSFQLNAQLGLVKINPDYSGISDKSSWKNTGFGISAGYRF